MAVEGQYFFNNTTREVFVQFLDIFNTFYIQKEDNRRIQVPIIIAPSSKIAYNLSRVRPEQRQITLPIISTFIEGIVINEELMTPRLPEFMKIPGTVTEYEESFASIPIKLKINLGIWVRYIDEKYQLFEQIVPLFGYHRVVYTKHPLFSDVNVKHWIKIVDTREDNSDKQTASDKRILKQEITFEIESMYFRPKNQTLSPILEIDMSFKEYVANNVLNQCFIFGDENTGEITKTC